MWFMCPQFGIATRNLKFEEKLWFNVVILVVVITFNLVILWFTLNVVLGGVKFGGFIFFPPIPGDEVGRATVRLDDVGLDRSFQGLAGCFREYIAHYTF